MDKIPMTTSGHVALTEEYRRRTSEERPRIIRDIAEARAHGDLSENAEYHAAKERQGYVNARLGQLKKRMGEVAMIDVTKIPRDRAGLGSKVVVLDSVKGEEISYHLVTSEDANVAEGRVSTSSPIGKSLLGKEVGDMVRLVTPGGTRSLEILSLKTIHDFIDSGENGKPPGEPQAS